VLSKPDLQRLAAAHLRDLVAAGDAAALAEEGGIRAARQHAATTSNYA
jgi:hypothetical protein